MTQELIKYLRDLAQTCVRLARVCPHLATSHGLQEIALDLMAKAKELEESQRNDAGCRHTAER
jgi:F420-dependent methylenetetrahydromethanopterin dehydrogenase